MTETYDILKALEHSFQYQVNCELTPEQCKCIIEWYEKYHKCQSVAIKQDARIAELETENAAGKAEPKPLAYWSDEKKQTYADNEGRSAKGARNE